MAHWLLLRLTIAIRVACCCTACAVGTLCAVTPALAQPRQTFALNGMWADVYTPVAAVRLGEPFFISVELRAQGDVPLTWLSVELDGRPLGRRDAIGLWPGTASRTTSSGTAPRRSTRRPATSSCASR